MIKIPSSTWIPSLKWHALCLGICLAVSVVCIGVLSLLSTRLPVPYAPRTPASGTTPWND